MSVTIYTLVCMCFMWISMLMYSIYIKTHTIYIYTADMCLGCIYAHTHSLSYVTVPARTRVQHKLYSFTILIGKQ